MNNKDLRQKLNENLPGVVKYINEKMPEGTKELKAQKQLLEAFVKELGDGKLEITEEETKVVRQVLENPCLPTANERNLSNNQNYSNYEKLQKYLKKFGITEKRMILMLQVLAFLSLVAACCYLIIYLTTIGIGAILLTALYGYGSGAVFGVAPMVPFLMTLLIPTGGTVVGLMMGTAPIVELGEGYQPIVMVDRKLADTAPENLGALWSDTDKVIVAVVFVCLVWLFLHYVVRPILTGLFSKKPTAEEIRQEFAPENRYSLGNKTRNEALASRHIC